MGYLERDFEEAMEIAFLADGLSKEKSENYDFETGLFKKSLFQFIQTTQQEKWEKLLNLTGSQIEKVFLERLTSTINQIGLIDTIRNGFIAKGISFEIAYFKPNSSMNAELQLKYDKNILSVTRQLFYSPHNRKSLDMVLSLNGIPIVTLELKNHMTGQDVHNAMKQYKEDRSPNELIFQFNKRSLVHFAVDTREVYMTTKIAKDKTYFLPFNKGNNGGAGNPINENNYDVSYLWEEVLHKDSLLDIVHRFIHLDDDKLIFPRFHQLNVVRKLTEDIKEKGTGENYLIQHSAGSGKSNSIAWLAHRLSSLHNNQNQAIFNSVIIVTDRKVLDKQIKDTIKSFEKVRGVVEWAEDGSNDLVRHLENGVKIIITTIQKFPYAIGKISQLKDRTYAVIIDEAHSSQTGEGAKALRETLGDKYSEEESDFLDAVQETINRKISSEGKQDNISFFAFTATPKKSTLEIFGTRKKILDPNEKPEPFHVYSMRQAIEEGFILDVLQNYTTYDAYYKLNQLNSNDPEVEKQKAKREVMKLVATDDKTINEKIKIIVEHYRNFTRHKINGKAKAMVVTSSREAAVKMKKSFDVYCQNHGYHDTKALVAFSGSVNGETEVSINEISENQLPNEFSTDNYQVLIVANKYQTGFNEPLLHTMYVDKALKDINAVQTLSRLNRTRTGKNDTLVIDFWNSVESIKESFQPYYQTTSIDEITDENMIYDVKHYLDNESIYYADEIKEYAQIYFGSSKEQNHHLLDRFIKQSVERYHALTPENQEEFKTRLKTYVKLYSYLTQITTFENKQMFELFVYATRLHSTIALPFSRDTQLNLEGELELSYFYLKNERFNTIELDKEDGEVLDNVGSGKVTKKEDTTRLSEIVDYFNTIFSEEFGSDEVNLLEGITRRLQNDTSVQAKAKKNKQNDFLQFSNFEDDFIDVLDDYDPNEHPLLNKMNSNDTFYEDVIKAIGKEVYNRIVHM